MAVTAPSVLPTSSSLLCECISPLQPRKLERNISAWETTAGAVPLCFVAPRALDEQFCWLSPSQTPQEWDRFLSMPVPFPIVFLPLLCLWCKACRNNLKTVPGLFFAAGILLNHIILAVLLEKKLSTSEQPLTIISAQLHTQSGMKGSDLLLPVHKSLQVHREQTVK